DLDGERNLRIRVANQVLSDAVDVFRNHRIVNQLYLSFDLLGELPAHRHLFLDAIPVAHTAAASHVAIADGIYVGLASIVFNLAVILGGQGRRSLFRSILDIGSLRLTSIRIRGWNLAWWRLLGCLLRGLRGRALRILSRNLPRGCLRNDP